MHPPKLSTSIKERNLFEIQFTFERKRSGFCRRIKFLQPSFTWIRVKSFQAALGKLRNDSQGDTDPWRQRGLPFGPTLPIVISEMLNNGLTRRNEICGKSQCMPVLLPSPFLQILSNICRRHIKITNGGTYICIKASCMVVAENATFAIIVSPSSKNGCYSTLKKRLWKDYKKKITNHV